MRTFSFLYKKINQLQGIFMWRRIDKSGFLSKRQVDYHNDNSELAIQDLTLLDTEACIHVIAKFSTKKNYLQFVADICLGEFSSRVLTDEKNRSISFTSRGHSELVLFVKAIQSIEPSIVEIEKDVSFTLATFSRSEKKICYVNPNTKSPVQSISLSVFGKTHIQMKVSARDKVSYEHLERAITDVVFRAYTLVCPEELYLHFTNTCPTLAVNFYKVIKFFEPDIGDFELNVARTFTFDISEIQAMPSWIRTGNFQRIWPITEELFYQSIDATSDIQIISLSYKDNMVRVMVEVLNKVSFCSVAKATIAAGFPAPKPEEAEIQIICGRFTDHLSVMKFIGSIKTVDSNVVEIEEEFAKLSVFMLSQRQPVPATTHPLRLFTRKKDASGLEEAVETTSVHGFHLC